MVDDQVMELLKLPFRQQGGSADPAKHDLLCSFRESCAFPAPADTGCPLAFCDGKFLVQRNFIENDSLVCYNKTKL